jgi:hypothetical protein
MAAPPLALTATYTYGATPPNVSPNISIPIIDAANDLLGNPNLLPFEIQQLRGLQYHKDRKNMAHLIRTIGDVRARLGMPPLNPPLQLGGRRRRTYRNIRRNKKGKKSRRHHK